jgi:4'-phosphopantetheinyl transferase
MLGPHSDAAFRLVENELHVWKLSLDAPTATLEEAKRVLTQLELTRFERILAPADRMRRMTARLGLRVLLGSYLAIDPREVEVAYGAKGRPELVGGPNLSFNLSHTADLAVFAIGRGRAVGVDIEALARCPPSARLIARTLDAGELARVMRVGGRERTEAFLRYWTIKEAYAKALGVGLALDFRDVAVRGRAERPRLELAGGDGEQWRVRRLRPRQGIVGAVVADGEPWRVRVRELRLTDERGARLTG